MTFDALRSLGIVGYELWKSHLVGNNCPANERRYRRMREPQIGDLVLEISSAPFWIYRPKKKAQWWQPENAIGKYLRQTQEPVPGDWGDEDVPNERVWYIETHDGREVRWTNADFITILPAESWGLGI